MRYLSRGFPFISAITCTICNVVFSRSKRWWLATYTPPPHQPLSALLFSETSSECHGGWISTQIYVCLLCPVWYLNRWLNMFTHLCSLSFSRDIMFLKLLLLILCTEIKIATIYLCNKKVIIFYFILLPIKSSPLINGEMLPLYNTREQKLSSLITAKYYLCIIARSKNFDV